MANLVLTYTTNSIRIDFNDYYDGVNVPNKSECYQIAHAIININDDGVFVRMDNLSEQKLGVNQLADNLVVDSVNGVIPTDENNLYELLCDIIE